MKVTEKQLKSRCTDLNLGPLKDTAFGLKVERTARGYTVSLVYRDSTPPETLVTDASAAEAYACISGVATTSTVFKAIQGTIKPEFVPQEVFVKQHGERCPKCGTRDINAGPMRVTRGELEQRHDCGRCGTVWYSTYRLTGYELPLAAIGESGGI